MLRKFDRSIVKHWILPVMLLSVGVSGCRSGDSNHDDVAVRLINAAPQADDLSVSVDGQHVWKHSLFASNTGFTGVGAGSYQVDITADLAGKRISGHNYLDCDKGKSYTVVALEGGPGVTDLPPLRIFSEEKEDAPPSNKVRLRFINAGGGLGSVDVLFDNIVGISDIPFGNQSQPLLLDPGVYDVKVNPADNVPALIGPASLHLNAGQSYTLVAMGRRGANSSGKSLSIQMYPDSP